MNWPNELDAVARPKAQERFSGGTIRPRAAMTIPKEESAMPMPTRMPPPKWKISGFPVKAMMSVPAQ
jgi:hypothetical protein